METPLTPLEFARRTRWLHPQREAVVDGALSVDVRAVSRPLRSLVVGAAGARRAAGDRVAYIAPNTHAQLESFYAVPQIGAVLVPINYRLTPDDFVYILNHSGSSIVCAHARLSRRPRLGARPAAGGSRVRGARRRARRLARTTKRSSRAAIRRFQPAAVAETDLLTINYTSGTTARPKGVMITHRNAYMNVVGTLLHLPLGSDDRYLWTLPMFHANGWTYTWIVTAAGGAHVCLGRSSRRAFSAAIREERITRSAPHRPS